ncbi:ferritin-like isoform X2 [Cylas formicarius]|nr:ferritin-like isoform X2 [Cylas formicarius]
MACYYGKTEVSLPGCQGFFMTMHRHEHEHGITLMNYILMRGGTVRVPNISVDSQSWNDVRKALGAALELECYVKEKLTEVVGIAERHKDFHLVEFISQDFLREQNESICTLARLLARSKSMIDTSVGEYLFDRLLFESFVVNSKENLMYLRMLKRQNSEDGVYK